MARRGEGRGGSGSSYEGQWEDGVAMARAGYKTLDLADTRDRGRRGIAPADGHASSRYPWQRSRFSEQQD